MLSLGLCGWLAVLGALVGLLPSSARADLPRRIVSLAPSITETLFALGAEAQLVGVSVYCDYPPAAKQIDQVGTFLTPNVEAIVAKRPDLVIAVPSPGNQNPVEALRRLGIEVMIVDPSSVAEIEASILSIGKATGREERARAVVAEMEQRMRAVRARLEGVAPRMVLMVVGQTPLIAAGAGTVQDELIRMAQGINLGARAGPSWPRLSIEFAIGAAPEVIIDTTMGNEERAGAEAALAFWNAFATIPAVQHKRVYGFREYQLLRPGPRVAEALETFARFIHPERME